MGAAALPCGAGQVRCDRVDQAGVGVGGDQPDPGQAAGDQVGEEQVPGGAGLAGGDLAAEHLAVTISVDPGRDHDDGVDHPAAFADLDRQRVSGDEGERAGLVQGRVAELGDVGVELGRHPRHLRFRQRVDAEGLDQLVHPTRRHPGQVAVGDHGDHR